VSRRDLAFATGVYVATRAVLVLVAWAALAWQPLVLEPDQWRAFPGHPWLDGWVRWDSAWYQSIFVEGYHYTPGQRSNANFFPLYAWVSGVLSLPLRRWLSSEGAFYAAAVVVAHVSSWLSMLGLHTLTRERLGRAAADRSVWLFCLFPFSFYLAAAYSEGLFLALAIWAFVLADRGRLAVACLLASLAAVTRVPGFLVAVGLGLEYVRRNGPDPRRFGREALALLATPVPLLLLVAGFAHFFGDPLVFVTTQRESWGRSLGIDVGAQIVALRSGLSWPGFWVTIWRLALLAATPAAVALAWRRLGWPLGVFTLLVLVLPVVSGIRGFERYFLAGFPAFAALGATLSRRAARLAVLAGFALFLLYFTFQFARWEQMVTFPQ